MTVEPSANSRYLAVSASNPKTGRTSLEYLDTEVNLDALLHQLNVLVAAFKIL